MAGWDAGRVRQAHGLTLTEAQKEAIRAKLPPSPEAGVYSADGVFEGGGVLGVAFLGAARCCSDIGIQWKGLAGTSAGAITAALLASDLTIDQLEQTLGGLDFNQFLSRKTSPLVLNGDPSNDLSEPVYMVSNLKLIGQLGEYSTEPARAWLEEALGKGGIATFGDVGRSDPDRRLKVVVSNISQGLMQVLPDDLGESLPGDPSAFSVAEAVRLSMSIPFFFAPGKLGDAVIVDGGILSNFPLWIYDVQHPETPSWPTFGFRLLNQQDQQVMQVRSVTDILGAMFRTMMYATDRYHISHQDKGRVIDLDITDAGVTTTMFDLGDDKKDQLYRIGYEGTRDFLLNLWNWEEHLEARGFSTA